MIQELSVLPMFVLFLPNIFGQVIVFMVQYL